VIAVVATIFGLATSLGFGAQQAASGLHFLFGIQNTIGLQVIIIACVTAVAVTVGLPFTAVMLVMIVSLYMGLRHEQKFGYNNPNMVFESQ